MGRGSIEGKGSQSGIDTKLSVKQKERIGAIVTGMYNDSIYFLLDYNDHGEPKSIPDPFGLNQIDYQGPLVPTQQPNKYLQLIGKFRVRPFQSFPREATLSVQAVTFGDSDAITVKQLHAVKGMKNVSKVLVNPISGEPVDLDLDEAQHARQKFNEAQKSEG